MVSIFLIETKSLAPFYLFTNTENSFTTFQVESGSDLMGIPIKKMQIATGCLESFSKSINLSLQKII